MKLIHLKLGILAVFLPVIASAADTKTDTKNAVSVNDVPTYGSYYTIDDSAARLQKVLTVNVSNWVRHAGDPQQSSRDYNRTGDFGRWIDDPTDNTCFNTRAKVLFRDSQTDVYVSNANECAIEEGHWKDPYTGAMLTSAADVQVDHVVPLKNAFISGAWKWSKVKRCAYANFMGNNFHLLAVDASENMSKGDKGPEGYLPSNKRYLCQYVSNWLKIKAIWNMTLNPLEVKAIKDVVQDQHCDVKLFQMTKTELERQRSKIRYYQNICQQAADELKLR